MFYIVCMRVSEPVQIQPNPFKPIRRNSGAEVYNYWARPTIRITWVGPIFNSQKKLKVRRFRRFFSYSFYSQKMIQ